MSTANVSESGAQLYARVSSKNRPLLLNLLPEILPRDESTSKQIIEICGESNVGKTMHLMELIARTVLPTAYGGKGAEAIVIDTNSSFSIASMMPRILEKYILLNRIEADAHAETEDLRASTDNVKELVFDAMKCIWIFPCYASECFDDILSWSITDLLTNRVRISLIAIDSICTFYWKEVEFKLRRDTYLQRKLKILKRLNQEHGTFVVYTKPMHFGRKTMENIDYRIELAEKDDGIYFVANCYDIGSEVAEPIHSRCYVINDFGVEWKHSSVK